MTPEQFSELIRRLRRIGRHAFMSLLFQAVIFALLLAGCEHAPERKPSFLSDPIQDAIDRSQRDGMELMLILSRTTNRDLFYGAMDTIRKELPRLYTNVLVVGRKDEILKDPIRQYERDLDAEVQLSNFNLRPKTNEFAHVQIVIGASTNTAYDQNREMVEGLVLRFPEPQPLTTNWLGRIVWRNPDDEKRVHPLVYPIKTGPEYDIGLRSDGLVVWRKAVEK